MMTLIGRIVAWIGSVTIMVRRRRQGNFPPAIGGAPMIPEAVPQGIMTLKTPTAKGWQGDHKPEVAAGLKVNAFATGLDHPRWMEVLPDGGVLVAESRGVQGGRPTTLFGLAMQATMQRVDSAGTSPNRLTLLRDADGDGTAEERHSYLTGLFHPFGMALAGETLYVGNTDGISAFPYVSGANGISAPGRKIVDFKPGGHWTRSLLLNSDKTKLYAGVGSKTNIGDEGLEAEEGRAAIWEIELATEAARIFASGLRNPVGMAWEPTTGTLYTVVNERDGIGDETPPDYLTSVREGGFYGWPFCYWGQTVDDRVPQKPEMVATALRPDYALGGHTASLGLCWHPAGTLPGFGDGMIVGQHGSWNRSVLSGYRVIFVPFEGGKPAGAPRDILWGCLSADEKFAYGRPVGVTLAADGALLVADDVGNAIWRVSAA